MEKQRSIPQDFIEHRYLLLLNDKFGFPLSILMLSVMAFLIGMAVIIPINNLMGGSIKTGLTVNLIICSTILPYHYYHILRLLHELDTLHSEVYDKSIRDELTHAYNRHYFFETVTRLDAGKKQTQQPLAVLMIDIDDFKNLNDKYGHHIGDEALKLLTVHSASVLRSSDILVRYGGDEFAALLPETSGVAAHLVMERLEQRWLEACRRGAARSVVGISYGVAAYPQEATTAAELVELADSRLYEHKRTSAAQFTNQS